MSKLLFNITYTAASPPSKLKGEDKAKYIARRQFYDMTAEFNILSYMLDGKKVCKNKDVNEYYTHGTNTGLFNSKGLLSEQDVEKLKEKLATTKSIIWHGFLSFDNELSAGFATQAAAIKFLNQSFNSFIERTHLDRNNIELFATLHIDTSHHHHIHFSFFEKEPKRRDKNGKLCYTSKGNINSTAIDNYLVAANMHVSDSGNGYWTTRDKAMTAFQGLRLGAAMPDEIKRRLYELEKKLPDTGCLQYNKKNMQPYRNEIDAIANMLVRSDPEAYRLHIEMQQQLAAKEKEVKQLCVENKLGYINNRKLTKDEIKEILAKGKTKYISEKYVDLSKVDYIDKLRQDYQSRLGNQVLNIIKKNKESFKNTRRAGKVNDKHLKIQARKKRQTTNKLLNTFMTNLVKNQQGLRTNFQKSLKQIEREIEAEKARSAV